MSFKINFTLFSYFSIILFFNSCFLFQTEFHAKVVGVKDGDSIEVLDSNRQNIIVRLSHVDCPEYGQPYSAEAKRFTSDFCFNKKVVLEQTDEDQYGRLVCEVFVDGESLNLALVENGFAWHFDRYSDDPDFADAEKQARKAKKGLWEDKRPVPPWEWRKRKREEYEN